MVSEEKINTYSTKVKPQQPLEISSERSGFEDVINEDGVIPTTLNVPVMVQRLAKDIYKNATSGIRELYMNAVRGCVDGVELFGYTEPHITVTINEAERIVIIEDNGRGITKTIFKQVLRELGVSDNFDGKTTGQFGMGFASYMTLASVCVLDTIGDNGDNYKMLCRDGTSSKYAGKAELDSHGVKLTLTCYPKVDFPEICDKLYDTARHANVPTTVIIEEFVYIPDNFSEGSNEIKQVRFDENMPDNIKYLSVKIETEDFTLLANDHINYRENHTYLLNVPIDSDLDVPFYFWKINIKDERKYQPMPNRDKMREEADKALQTKITDALHDHFKDIKIKNYSEYITSDRKLEFQWLMSHVDYAPEELRALLHQLNMCTELRAVTYEKDQLFAYSLGDWLRAAGEAGITYQGYKNKDYTKKVREFIPAQCQLLTAQKGKENNWKESVAILELFGVPTVKQILKDNKVKIPKRVAGDGKGKTIVGHTNERGYNTNDLYVEEVEANCVRVDSLKMTEMISFVREFPTEMTFMRNEPSLKSTKCQALSVWIEDFKTVEVNTNKGLMTADALAQKPNLSYCKDLVTSTEAIVEHLDNTMIMDNGKVLGVALLKYLYYNDNKTRWLSNLIETKYIGLLFAKKYGVNMYSNDAKIYFCSHLKEIKGVHHELFARIIANVYSNYADKVADTLLEKHLATLKEFGDFEENDEIGKIKFYYNKWNHLPNKEAGITKIFERMMGKARKNIIDNNYTLAKFVQEEVLPKIFGEIVIRKLHEVENTYPNTFRASFTTKLRTLNFKKNFNVYGMNVKIQNTNLRIFNKHSLVNADLEIIT